MTHVLSLLTTPSGVAYVLFFAGLIAAVWKRTHRVSWYLLAGSGLVTVAFSSGMVAAALMSPLEYAYPTLHEPQKHPEARHIVVLTAFASEDPDMPLTGKFGTSTAYRVLMALEMYRDRPDCDVIVSGDPTAARLMGEALVKLGLPSDKLRLENESLTTADSAIHLKPLLGNDKFFLVTSAGHLPRSVAVLRKQGLDPIPAPTDHQLPRNWLNAQSAPTPGSLVVSDLATHEYLGLLWYRFRGRL